jgi:hypothetical protein
MAKASLKVSKIAICTSEIKACLSLRHQKNKIQNDHNQTIQVIKYGKDQVLQVAGTALRVRGFKTTYV